ncbi:MAG: isocitrate lyase/phosphoenolpyruvate mutase family protein [Alphaproteobacteria bacterium]|nr:isocitrate lyase/phosphoenolpyruvate mutase family protein [Alphaproteobacteria bacterium]
MSQRAGHIMPGAYDALSAKIAEQAGFPIVTAGGFAAIGSMLGGPDIGQSNMRDYALHYARIAAAIDVPLSVDADTGFGGVHNVAEMVRTFEAGDIAGIMIGDQAFPNRCGYLPGKSVIPVEEMLAKIRAAVAARRDPDTVIIARTDAFAIEGLDSALARCHLYLEAGADLAKPQGVDKPADIRHAIETVPCPFAATLSQAARVRELDIADLRALGVATISLPSIMLFAAANAVRATMATLAGNRSLASVERDLMPLDDYNRLVGLDRLMALEAEFQNDATRILERARDPRSAASD